MKICIDAGHGGTDSGAVGVSNRYEKNDTLKMALALQQEMGRRGHAVTMTRTSDTYPSISSRYKLANASGVDVFVSLHRNSASATANGVEVLYRTVTNKSAANDAKSKTLAQEIDKRIVRATGFRDRGAKAQNYNTAVLQYTNMPAVTVEAGFVSNAGDNAIFDERFDGIISAIADGIEYVMTGKVSSAASSGAGASSSNTSAAQAPTAAQSIPAFFQNGGVVKLKSPYMRGSDVLWAQTAMANKGFSCGKLDGIWGPKSDAAAKSFQKDAISKGRDCGCGTTPDGKIGRKTAAILAE